MDNTQIEPSNLNYHITWSECGSVSSGWTDAVVGPYPATDSNEAYIVAPGEYIRAYCAEHDPEDRYPGTAEEAARAWAREQGYRTA